MLNENRGSDNQKRQSRRRTLLCYLTLCLFVFLIFFLLLTKVFHYHRIKYDNQTISLNVIKFRLSLIQCGQSVVKQENLYKIIQQLPELIKTTKDISLNEELNKNYFKENIIRWLEYILKECYQARQFSIIEQNNPMIITQIISIIRKEILYIAAFFIKDV
ncbi:unnamed protein product [Adineta steineri]|uniref:Transmembrane protein n=1 Tax=Adineta steineri TaxID=433720 RepID=A0A818P740_9BILA|nr:unnamed protein product [Adineta steineri]CAF3618658.1 unnamed protein product [Adineta steineri]